MLSTTVEVPLILPGEKLHNFFTISPASEALSGLTVEITDNETDTYIQLFDEIDRRIFNRIASWSSKYESDSFDFADTKEIEMHINVLAQIADKFEDIPAINRYLKNIEGQADEHAYEIAYLQLFKTILIQDILPLLNNTASLPGRYQIQALYGFAAFTSECNKILYGSINEYDPRCELYEALIRYAIKLPTPLVGSKSPCYSELVMMNSAQMLATINAKNIISAQQAFGNMKVGYTIRRNPVIHQINRNFYQIFISTADYLNSN